MHDPMHFCCTKSSRKEESLKKMTYNVEGLCTRRQTQTLTESEKMPSDRRLIVREVASEVSVGLAHVNLTNTLGMRRISAKFVLKILTEAQSRSNITAAWTSCKLLKVSKTFRNAS